MSLLRSLTVSAIVAALAACAPAPQRPRAPAKPAAPTPAPDQTKPQAPAGVTVSSVEHKVMMDAWKTSPGHRRNMLLADVTEIGVGAGIGKSGRWYFVQLFGRPPDPPRAVKASK